MSNIYTNKEYQICNLQLEFRKITSFEHALPRNGHSGLLDIKLLRK